MYVSNESAETHYLDMTTESMELPQSIVWNEGTYRDCQAKGLEIDSMWQRLNRVTVVALEGSGKSSAMFAIYVLS